MEEGEDVFGVEFVFGVVGKNWKCGMCCGFRGF